MARILIVDDSATLRKMIADTLESANFAVTQAIHGKDALSKISGQSFNLVITDFNMPIMNGVELVRELRKRPEFKSTPILFLTTESDQSRKMEGKAAGANGWVIKPFEPNQLLQVIAKLVR